MQRGSPEQFEQAGRAGGGGEGTDSWVAQLDSRSDNPASHRVRSGRRDAELIGYGLRGLAGEEARAASVEAPAVETLPSPESTLPRNPPRPSRC